ncbi:type I toxin-antitoxin system toxin SymE [Serratia fonticola]|uniref:Type I toxin-antitoxin system toxin SymE n=1 Tax=Serratia fonticola TaxID=47917 RepID=A0A542BNA4_SERFO|nr:SymE family type I addiction module toxin [Serratia fonticola]TQI80071.1 type I toxin-antitoxin system toxin SymE [Serratia fonticola]TQI97904.1 type I toxin-antitoxin system toxin SymE [Serratia fonticola]TVZ72400.1 type I toxin-antitoxin system toxin SymE [Serratia fonticola]
MNGTNIIKATTGGFIPELIIDGEDIIKAGFTPGAVFNIEQNQDGLIITLTTDEAEIKRLLLEVDAHPDIGVDWVRDNGELYLAREWLTQSGLTGQPLAVSVMPGKVVIRVQQGNMLA